MKSHSRQLRISVLRKIAPANPKQMRRGSSFFRDSPSQHNTHPSPTVVLSQVASLLPSSIRNSHHWKPQTSRHRKHTNMDCLTDKKQSTSVFWSRGFGDYIRCTSDWCTSTSGMRSAPTQSKKITWGDNGTVTPGKVTTSETSTLKLSHSTGRPAGAANIIALAGRGEGLSVVNRSCATSSFAASKATAGVDRRSAWAVGVVVAASSCVGGKVECPSTSTIVAGLPGTAGISCRLALAAREVISTARGIGVGIVCPRAAVVVAGLWRPARVRRRLAFTAGKEVLACTVALPVLMSKLPPQLLPSHDCGEPHVLTVAWHWQPAKKFLHVALPFAPQKEAFRLHPLALGYSFRKSLRGRQSNY